MTPWIRFPTPLGQVLGAPQTGFRGPMDRCFSESPTCILRTVSCAASVMCANHVSRVCIRVRGSFPVQRHG